MKYWVFAIQLYQSGVEIGICRHLRGKHEKLEMLPRISKSNFSVGNLLIASWSSNQHWILFLFLSSQTQTPKPGNPAHCLIKQTPLTPKISNQSSTKINAHVCWRLLCLSVIFSWVLFRSSLIRFTSRLSTHLGGSYSTGPTRGPHLHRRNHHRKQQLGSWAGRWTARSVGSMRKIRDPRWSSIRSRSGRRIRPVRRLLYRRDPFRPWLVRFWACRLRRGFLGRCLEFIYVSESSAEILEVDYRTSIFYAERNIKKL